MKKSKWVLGISLIFLFLFMMLAGYYNAGCGTVTVKNIYYPDTEGNVLRGQLFLPKGVSSVNPAPGIINMHGGGDHLECVGNFSLELARRGYVVLAVDAYGSGYSDYATGAVATSAGGSGTQAKSSALKMDGGATVSLEKMLTYSFVDQNNIGLIGHSMGGTYIANAALAHKNNIKAIMPWGSGSFVDMLKKHSPEEFTFNVGYINAKSDEMVVFASHLRDTTKLLDEDFLKSFFGTTETIVAGKAYGSFADKNARVIYTPQASHIGNIISKESIGDLLGYFESAMPTGTELTPKNQIWQWKQLFSILAIISLLCFTISLGFVLLDGKTFNSLVVTEEKKTIPMGKVMRWGGIALLVIIPMLTLYKIGLPLTTIKASRFFPMNWGNYFAWLSAVNGGIIGVCFLIWHFAYGKKHGGNLKSYGFPSKEVSLGHNGMQVGKVIGFGVTIIFAIYVIVNICYAMFNIDFRIWMGALKPITPQRLTYIWGYLLMFLISFGVLNMVSISFADLSAGSQTKWGIVRQYFIGWVIATGGFALILIIYYAGLRINHYPPFFYGYGPFPAGHPNSLVFSMKQVVNVPLFTFASFVNTAFYRRTKNIYVGWLVAALFIAMTTITGNAFTF
ncbi:alpha/beta fold hydrolase [uncultured Sphaerochaeta sp.]|uniref:alpha/beta hydrolase n=1 Tax=uncultured Sphaerochaeta sp. TaxID=886478 RepID=UPI002A0A408D|nr:alpha/beta fold hydrolase [uncultured Sphaerochaeta sp.]